MELWDAYDAYGNQTGETLVRGEEIPDGRYHMVCEVLVRHADGSVLCMKRAESKPNYGGFGKPPREAPPCRGRIALLA